MDTHVQPTRQPVSPGVLGIYHININVSFLERSRAFYEMLGFRVVDQFSQAGQPDLDRGLGYDYTDCRALFMGLGRNRFETVIDIVEWKEPKSKKQAMRMHDIGAQRIALRVKHIDEVVQHLSSQGVRFISDIQQLDFLMRKARFVCCQDPDGLVIEFVELLESNS